MGVSAIGERRWIHSSADLSELQTVIAEKLIDAKSIDRSVAVIPEDQAVVFRRIIIYSKPQELCQSLLGSHVGVAVCSTDDPVVFPSGQIQHTVAVTGYISEPFTRAACIDDDVIFLKINAGRQHLLQVVSGRAAVGLQIGADHIDKDCIVFGRSGQIIPCKRNFRVLRLLDLIGRCHGPAVIITFRSGRRISFRRAPGRIGSCIVLLPGKIQKAFLAGRICFLRRTAGIL